MRTTKVRDDSATDSPDESDVDASRSHTNAVKMPSSYFKNIKIKGYDTPDALPKTLKFTWLDIVGITVSICSFILDMVFDVLLAYIYFANGQRLYFALTIAFVAIPSLAMTGFSLRWYLEDADCRKLPPVSVGRWVVRMIFLILQMGPVLRYLDSLLYGLESNKNKKNVEKQTIYYKQMIYEDADATLLRLIECFLESAPQLLLQMYIFAKPETFVGNSYSVTETLQLISIFTSLLSMSWALASYQRALRYSLEDKLNMTWCGTLAQILWRFFELSSRVIALGLFATLFTLHFAIVCAVHYSVMVVWILIMRTSFCENKCEEFLYNAILGVIFIFCYFNPKDSPTRRRYTFYYVCVFLENTALMAIWFVHVPAHMSYRYPAMVLQFLGFALGITVMIIYYLLLHPTKNINIWASWTKNKTADISYQNGECNVRDVTVQTSLPQD